MVSPWISLLALALGTTCSLADSPSVAQQLAAGVSKPLDLSNVTADYFNEAQPVIARNGPSQPIPLGLRQATRAQILSAVRRKDQRLYRKQVRGSDKPATCVPDSESPNSGVKAAVFSDIATSDNGMELGEEPSSEIGACAQFCESFSTCTFSYIYDGICYAKDATILAGMTQFAGDDQFAFLGEDCYGVKQAIPGASLQSCCNLYY